MRYLIHLGLVAELTRVKPALAQQFEGIVEQSEVEEGLEELGVGFFIWVEEGGVEDGDRDKDQSADGQKEEGSFALFTQHGVRLDEVTVQHPALFVCLYHC